jgi:hypothetical protein
MVMAGARAVILKKMFKVLLNWFHGKNWKFGRKQQRSCYHTSLKTSDLATANTQWNLDIGASAQMTFDREDFFRYSPCSGEESVVFGDGSNGLIAGYESLILDRNFGLQNVLHVPSLSARLLSVGELDKRGCSIIFKGGAATIEKSKRKLGYFHLKEGIYVKEEREKYVAFLTKTRNEEAYRLLHEQFGHPSQSVMQHIKGYTGSKMSCETCQKAKGPKDINHALKADWNLPREFWKSCIWI